MRIRAARIMPGLPDAEQMLHDKTYAGNANPAAEPHDNRLSAGLYKLYDVCIQTDGCHGKDDEEFA